jgi:NarL family two-component system sensor histidine kinase LiaS
VSLTQRVKLAQELHDGIAQDLVGLGYGLDSLLFSEEDETKRASLRAVRFDISTLIEKVRQEIFELRHSLEIDEPLFTANTLQGDLAKSLNEIVGNALHHSHATELFISIRDNGIGGAEEKINHFGLQGILERMGAHGAQINLQSDFTGTSLKMTVPIGEK